jgi:hypothetical protein
MAAPDAPGVRRALKVLLLCGAAFAVGILGVRFTANSGASHSHAPRPGGWYDFSPHMNLDWSGPKAGERLDLQRFSGPGGEKLTDAAGGDLLMLATVDPDCAAARAARDELRDVRTHIAEAGVPYFLVCATTNRPPDEFYKYAESLALDARAFLWSSKDISPPQSLDTMVVPSHILVSRDGTILRTWPGTSQTKRVRFLMANQIIADTMEVVASLP